MPCEERTPDDVDVGDLYLRSAVAFVIVTEKFALLLSGRLGCMESGETFEFDRQCVRTNYYLVHRRRWGQAIF